MTIIAAIKDSDSVLLGSDSCTGNSAYVLTVSRPKVFTRELRKDGLSVHRQVAFGTSGDFRGDSLLRNMRLPDYNGNVGVWVEELSDSMREVFESRGYATKENGHDSQELSILVGVAGRIFSIWQDYDVIENGEDYMAIGSGMYFALGAFYATEKLLEPEKRLYLALGAAAAHNPYVQPPFNVVRV